MQTLTSLGRGTGIASTKMYEAEFKYHGKIYKACWFSMGTVVMVMDETGEATPVPVARFTKEPEA